MPRYALEVTYDGTCFHGSQIQGDETTVQLALNKALTTLFRQPIETVGASRTDEGVHALSNFYHFDLDEPLRFDLLYKCNAILPSSMAVKKVYAAIKPDFNARFDAATRRYRYRIYPAKDPFRLNRAMHYPFALSFHQLQSTASVILQHSHFESFCKRNSQSKTFICHISQSYWERKDDELQYVVAANRFLRGMVRGLVSTQLHIARQGKTTDDFLHIIEARDCTRAFFDVPGHGLYLEEITYPPGLLTALNTRELS